MPAGLEYATARIFCFFADRLFQVLAHALDVGFGIARR